MAIGYTINHIQGTHSRHFKRVHRNMDVVCQEIISQINAAEVNKLAALPGVGYASFGSAVVDPPNGTIVADGWLDNIRIEGFSQTTTKKWGVNRWEADITVSYTGIAVLAQVGVGEASRPTQGANALHMLREQFSKQDGI